MYRAMRFLHSSAKNHHPRYCRRRGEPWTVQRAVKSKETGVDAGQSREQEKGEINLTLVNFTPLNYRC